MVKYRDHACFKRILVHAHVYTYDALSSTHVAARACTGSPACNALQGRILKYQNAEGASRQRENFTSRALSPLTFLCCLISRVRAAHLLKRLLSVIDLAISTENLINFDTSSFSFFPHICDYYARVSRSLFCFIMAKIAIIYTY